MTEAMTKPAPRTQHRKRSAVDIVQWVIVAIGAAGGVLLPLAGANSLALMFGAGLILAFTQGIRRYGTCRAPPTDYRTDPFGDEYNHRRPHRSLPHRATQATVYAARPKAAPGRTATTHERVRADRIDKAGVVTMRHDGRLHHIEVGRTYAGTYVLLLVQDLDIRIIDAVTGELLRELILDPAKDYQGTGRSPGPAPKKQKAGPTVS